MRRLRFELRFTRSRPLPRSRRAHWILVAALVTAAGTSHSSLDANVDLEYATHIGGTGGDTVEAVLVDSEGAVYLAGLTSSPDLPVQGYEYDRGCGLDGTCGTASGEPATDAFVMKLDSTGRRVEWVSYLGGSGDDAAVDLAFSRSGDLIVLGTTNSRDFPATSSFPAEHGGGDCPDDEGNVDAFVAKLARDGGSLEFATYLGGCEDDEPKAVAVDSRDRIIVVGYTSGDFQLTEFGPDFTYNGGIHDAFVAMISPDGRHLISSGYLGGSADDRAHDVAVDRNDRLWIGGTSVIHSDGFPAPGGNLPPKGGRDAWIMEIDLSAPGLKSIIDVDVIGGSYADEILAVEFGRSNSLYVAGATQSSDFPVSSDAAQPRCECHGEEQSSFSAAWVGRWNPSSDEFDWATYLGGNQHDEARAIAVDRLDRVWVTGWTRSKDFITEAPFQETLEGDDSDAFVAVVSPTGRTLLHSSFLGGGEGGLLIAGPRDAGFSIAVNPEGDTAWLGGFTWSSNFPTTDDAVRPDPDRTTAPGTWEGWIAKTAPFRIGLLARNLASEVRLLVDVSVAERETMAGFILSAAAAYEDEDAERGDELVGLFILEVERQMRIGTIDGGLARSLVRAAHDAARVGRHESESKSTDPLFTRGDCNSDRSVDISDVLSVLGMLFSIGGEPGCRDACDTNDDGRVDISDPILTLNVLFSGFGTVPAPGMNQCGIDPTDDGVDCASSPAACAAE